MANFRLLKFHGYARIRLVPGGLISLARRCYSSGNIDKCLQSLSDFSVTPAWKRSVSTEKAPGFTIHAAFAREHPSFVSLPNCVEDVQRCMQVASYYQVPLTVKSGGHCFGGYSTIVTAVDSLFP